MSGEIYDFTSPFAFSAIELGAPVKKGSGYTIRFSINDNPIYLQPPKCYLKSPFTSPGGQSKSGKTAYCDLLFGMENEKFISWAEELERNVISRIYERRADWFDVADPQAMPTMEDIQSYVQPIGKSYKSGRMYLVRTTLVPAELHVWDEHEREVEHEALSENMRVVVIMELKQLNCSATSFQFVFELKQMMLSPERTANFSKCLIKSREPKDEPSLILSTPIPPRTEPIGTSDLGKSGIKDKEPAVVDNIRHSDSDKSSERSGETTFGIKAEESVQDKPSTTTLKPKKPAVEEVELDLGELEDDVETIHLTDPNEVYFKMYKEARRKMKEAKLLALSNYLEAKRIKTTYLADMQLEEDEDSE